MLISLRGRRGGAALAYTGLRVVNRRQTQVLLAENALLRARLCSLLVLAEHDLLRPHDPEIQALLGETRSYLLPEKERPCDARVLIAVLLAGSLAAVTWAARDER